MAQWVWNLRLELGHHLEPTALRLTEFAPAIPPQSEQAPTSPAPATSWKTGRFSGQAFPLQPDGTLRCPAGQSLRAHERRREADGSLRVVYAASIRSCRPCPLREQCQLNGNATAKPRQVSVLFHPLTIGSEPIRWCDWPRRLHRRACMHLVRHQRVEVQLKPPGKPPLASPPPMLSRSKRYHYRLDWQERFARNERASGAPQISITLFGVPEDFAAFLGLKMA